MTDSRHSIINSNVPYLGSARMEIDCDWAENEAMTNVFEGVHYCPFCGWVIEPEEKGEG